MASTFSSDAKIDSLVRKMEKLMERINLNERTPPRENQPNPQNRNRNQNFIRYPPQIRQREIDQQIRPPFQDNYMDEEERETEQPEENVVNLIGSDNEGDVFRIEEEQGLFSWNKNDRKNYEESEEYNLGFKNDIMEVHRQYDLRSKNNQEASKTNKQETAIKKTPVNIMKKVAENKITMDKKSNPNKDKISQ